MSEDERGSKALTVGGEVVPGWSAPEGEPTVEADTPAPARAASVHRRPPAGALASIVAGIALYEVAAESLNRALEAPVLPSVMSIRFSTAPLGKAVGAAAAGVGGSFSAGLLGYAAWMVARGASAGT